MRTSNGQRKALASSISLVVSVLVSGGFVVGNADAQWQIAEPAPTTADLRGIDYVGNRVAWASGTEGTVLRTEDSGYLWQRCSVPRGAEHLDFRGVQAFDANTAIVMSSGKGSLTRLYKTTDGCQTWKLVFTNPDADGFFDAVKFHGSTQGVVLGDPVDGKFVLWQSSDQGATWARANSGFPQFLARSMRPAIDGEGAFAASNSALLVSSGFVAFVTGGAPGARIFFAEWFPSAAGGGGGSVGIYTLRMAKGSASAGAFSIFRREDDSWIVIVGGDYLRPGESSGTAVSGFGRAFAPSETPPHGYRSAVVYDAASKTWITVGPNGTDISADDGRNWRALRPDAARGDAPDADQHWNALSLPFAVGPHGRIGKLRADALKSAPSRGK